MDSDLKDYLLLINQDVQSFRSTIESYSIINQPNSEFRLIDSKNSNLYQALRKVSESVASSYAQVRSDLESEERISWAGTAHEIREMVANMLRLLAPDQEVMSEAWYKQEPKTVGPTQKQRAKYILQKQNAGSKQTNVLKEIELIDERVASLIRATYSRASDAAHRMKDKSEAKRIFRYFEAFAYDLLNLE